MLSFLIDLFDFLGQGGPISAAALWIGLLLCVPATRMALTALRRAPGTSNTWRAMGHDFLMVVTVVVGAFLAIGGTAGL